MTVYSFELGERQSSRVLEQSVLARATVWAEPIDLSALRAVTGHFGKVTEAAVVLHVSSEVPELKEAIPGQYYQFVITLTDNRYLTVSDLIEVKGSMEGPVMVFTRPRNVQVLQRRRYVRYRLDQSYPVYVNWDLANPQPGNAILGQIRDLSVQGMGLRLPETMDDHLFIGEKVRLRFSVGLRDPEYFTEATICHKSLCKEESALILGVQFVPTNQSDDFQSRLRAALVQESGSKKGIGKQETK